MKQPPKFEFTISGLLIALVLVTMMATGFALFFAGIEEKMNTGANSSFELYNNTQQILNYSQTIEDATNIQQDKGILDVIGGYFASGYAAIKIAFSSFGLFESMMDQAAEDVEYFAVFKTLFVALILILLLILLITVLIKWKV